MINSILIGAGNIGYKYDSNLSKKYFLTHYKSIKKSKYINLLYIVEKKKYIIRKLKNRIPVIGNVSDVDIKNKVDLLIISTNTENHISEAIKSIKKFNVKTILCEKPVDYNIKKIIKFRNFCKKKKIKVFVNYFRKSNPNLKIIKKYFTKLKINKILSTYTKDFMHNAFHIIDMVNFLNNNKKMNLKYISNKKEDVHIQSGKINLIISKINKKIDQHNIFLYGEEGYIEYKNNGSKINIYLLKNNKEFYQKKFKKITLKSGFEKNQLYVVNQLERYFKKKKFYLSNIDDEIKYHKLIN